MQMFGFLYCYFYGAWKSNEKEIQFVRLWDDENEADPAWADVLFSYFRI